MAARDVFNKNIIYCQKLKSSRAMTASSKCFILLKWILSENGPADGGINNYLYEITLLKVVIRTLYI